MSKKTEKTPETAETPQIEMRLYYFALKFLAENGEILFQNFSYDHKTRHFFNINHRSVIRLHSEFEQELLSHIEGFDETKLYTPKIYKPSDNLKRIEIHANTATQSIRAKETDVIDLFYVHPARLHIAENEFKKLKIPYEVSYDPYKTHYKYGFFVKASDLAKFCECSSFQLRRQTGRQYRANYYYMNENGYMERSKFLPLGVIVLIDDDNEIAVNLSDKRLLRSDQKILKNHPDELIFSEIIRENTYSRHRIFKNFDKLKPKSKPKSKPKANPTPAPADG